MVTAGANVFFPASGDYRLIFGRSVFMPEVKVTCLVYRNFSLWSGFAWVAKQGMVKEVNETAKINQTFLSLGAGYAQKLSGRLRLRGELGLTYVSFREEALQRVQKGSGLGWKIGADLDYFIGKRLFVMVAAGYSKTGDETEAGEIDLGGAQLGGGIGFII
jgi:predicted porin